MFRKIITFHSVILITSALATQSFAQPAESSMADFAYGVELTEADTDIRRFTLTPIILKGVERRDLGDVRVFDYYNDLMPMKVIQTDSHIETYRQAVNFKKYIKAGELQGYVIERPKDHKRWLKSLQLKWRQGAAPKVLVLRIEHSADRKNWKTLKQSEVVSNYRFGTALLKHNVIDINNYTDRFLRLVFEQKKHVVPILQSVDSYITSEKLPDSKWITTGKLEPESDKPGRYVFSTGAGITPRWLSLHFDKLNTLLSGSLYYLSNEGEKLQWKLASKDFSSYKVTLNNKVVRSRPIRLDHLQASRWMIVVDADSEPAEALPDVMVAYPAYEVVYAAEGDEPYTLVWGQPQAGAPVSGEIAPTDDIAVVHRGRFMDNAALAEVVESRRFMLMLTIGGLVLLVIAAAGFVIYYRRTRNS